MDYLKEKLYLLFILVIPFSMQLHEKKGLYNIINITIIMIIIIIIIVIVKI